MSSLMDGGGLGLVLVEFQYEYQDRDGVWISIRPNERYALLAKTNAHWWQVRRDSDSKPFYIPAKYVKELPPAIPSPLDFVTPPPKASTLPPPLPILLPTQSSSSSLKGSDRGEDSKPGDEVTIRLRPGGAGHRRTGGENRLSTFGVPLDLPHALPSLPSLPSLPWTSNPASENPNMGTRSGMLGRPLEDKPRVPSFSPADPLPAPRPHLPIAVETPVVPPPITVETPVVPPPIAAETPVVPPPIAVETLVVPPPIAAETPVVPLLENKQEEQGEEKEQEPASPQPEVEEQEAGVKQRRGGGGEDGHHIYESIQDLNLDLEALHRETEGTLGKGVFMTSSKSVSDTPSSQSPLCPVSPIYANVTNLKKLTVSAPDPSHPQEGTLPATNPIHAPLDSPQSPSFSSPGLLSPASPLNTQEGWQVVPDRVSGKVYYFHPLTGETTWTDPRGPSVFEEVDRSREGEEPLTPPSPASSQGSSVWEQHVDERSGRPYYYNPSSGTTSWAPPPPLSPSSPASHPQTELDRPPPLPEEDYPVDEESETQEKCAGLIPRAQLEPTWGRSIHLGKPEQLGTLGNGVPEELPWRHSMVLPHAVDKWERSKRRKNLSARSPDLVHAHQLEKAGVLNKTKVVENGKKIRKNWAPSWTVLHGGILTFHRDPKTSNTSNSSKTSQIVPEYTVDLRGSSLSWANKDKSSKKNVLELKTRQGCEYLVQYDTDSIIWDWHKVILEAIRQLEPDHLSEDEDDEEEEKNRNTGQTGWAGEWDQGRVRVKLRRFLQRRPTLQSVKEKGYIRDNVFGCHLDTLCHRENSTVPKFLEKCIRAVERRGLDVDGIYRVSGNLAVIQKLRHKADHEESLDLDDGQWDEVHVVTGALKLFLRELPEPLFPFSSFDKFIAAIQEPDYSQKVSFMKDLIGCLPLPNHDTMATLFRHLLKVIEHGESNRMSVPSVSIVFGPTLLRPQTESANFTVHMVFQTRIVELILNEFHTLFPSQ